MTRTLNGSHGITIIQAAVAIVGIVCATVALTFGAIDGAAYMALVGPVLGISLGIGAYTSGEHKQILRNGKTSALVAEVVAQLRQQEVGRGQK